MKRIAVGQICQESNSLNPVPTTLADYEAFGLATGPDVMAQYGDVCELAGFAELPEVLGEAVEWVGLLRAYAWPGGPIDDGVLDHFTDRLAGTLRNAEIDGVLFSLHGAQCSETEPDASGRILSEMRKAVGPSVPLVATLDLHANVTPLMVRSADVLVGYHTHPHTDHIPCGQRAARALARLLQSDERPTVDAWKIPMVTNNDGRATDTGVLAPLWRRIVEAEQRDDVLSVGLYQVQTWLDVPGLGWTFYQAYLSDTPPLDPGEVAEACWETRGFAERTFLRPGKIVPAALGIPGKPVVVSEGYDATNSGAPGDSTHLLAEFAKQDIPDGGALSFCIDPEAVAQCVDVGEGASVDLNIGGKRDRRNCKPLPIAGEVIRLGNLSYILTGHGAKNLAIDMGRAAVVRSGSLTVALTQKTGPGSSPMLYEAMGLDPRDFKIVVAKSPEGFRRDYESFAAGILYCDAPGCATPRVRSIPFQRVSRPLYPMDEFDDLSAAEWAGDMMRRDTP